MDAYFHHCFDQRVQVNSVKANQRLLDNLIRILAESEVKKDEEELTTTGWYTESSKTSSTWPKDLWRMYRKNDQDAEEESRWEVALYRVTQLLSLILDIPSEKVNDLITGSIWDMIDFYGNILDELGGQLEGRLVPRSHYGLKQLNQHMSHDKACDRAAKVNAVEHYTAWCGHMGKEADANLFPQDALTYEDVAGVRWSDLWRTSPTIQSRKTPPQRVLVLGTSLLM